MSKCLHCGGGHLADECPDADVVNGSRPGANGGGGTAYVAIRIKASDPLMCYACGSLDGDGHEGRPFMWTQQWRVKSVRETSPENWSISLEPWPKRSTIAAMMAARRARARKSKPITPETESVHRAISAMQKPGRAHEL